MEAKGGPRGAKMEAKDPFWGAQMQLNGLNCEPEAPRKESLGVLGRMSEQPERPSSKNLKKDTLPKAFRTASQKNNNSLENPETQTHRLRIILWQGGIDAH